MMSMLKRPFSFLRSAGGLLAPTDVAVFQAEPVAAGILIEERRQTGLARNIIKTCGAMIVVFLIWAFLTPVHETVSGQGSVMPGDTVTKIQNLEGGIVSQVLVSPGDRIEANDVLVVLDAIYSQAELAKAYTRLESVNLSISRLQGLVDGQPPAEPETSFEIMGTVDTWSLRRVSDPALPAQTAGVAQGQRLVASQAAAAVSAEEFRTAQQEVIAADILTKEAELAGLLVEQEKTREELEILNRQLEDYQAALRTGAISRRERDGVMREKLALERTGARLDSQIASARETIGQAVARTTELLARLRHESLVNITQLETERAETESLIRQLEDRVARQRITSPIAGVVHVVNVHEAGDIISPADVILEIVPEGGRLFAQVEVPAEKIGDVQVGMDAKIKVLTYDFARFGTIDAVVEQVSPTSAMNEEGQLVFKVDLRLATDFVGPESAQRHLSPGMTVTADVTAGTKSVLHYLLRPLRVLSDRALTES